MDSTPLMKKKETIVKKRSRAMKKKAKSEDKIPIQGLKEGGNTKRRARMARSKGKGIIYIGRIPHGFYEDEMKSYFNQFGKVLGTFVARSKKTGRSKGYGFVEFEDEEVAKIAAETMNNYLMFNRIIKCRYIPPDERRGKVTEGKIRPGNFPRQRNRIMNLQNNMKALSSLTQSSYMEKVQKKVSQFQKFFQERGIDFSFKINPANNTSSKGEKKRKTNKSKSVSKTLIQEDAEQEFGVLEIDESENEISFETPPQVKKVLKKSVSSPANSPAFSSSSNSQTGKKKAVKLPKKSISNKTQTKKKVKQETSRNVPGIRKKLGKKTKEKEKFVKSLKSKKNLLVKNTTKSKDRKTNEKVGNLIKNNSSNITKKGGNKRKV